MSVDVPHTLLALQVSSLVLAGAAASSFAWSTMQSRSAFLHRALALYVAYLDRKQRNMLMTHPTGTTIVRAQALSLIVVLALSLYLGLPELHLLQLPIAVAPMIYLERRSVARRKRIEEKLDGFIITLANALKSTPSLGNALSYAEPLLSAPMDEEVGLALKELRVGNTIEQALLNMSARVCSVQLDATLSGLLIGRQVGGNLAQILETTARTLREMTRLQGVVRAKTAEGKGQLIVLAVFPVFMIALFDAASPGYFDPLSCSTTGYLVISAAVVLWVLAIVIARKVLTVDI